MKNIVTAGIVILVVIPVALFFGYHFVPGVKGTDGALFTSDFWFNGYLIFLGFFLTSAAIGPIVAQFVEWRADKEWATARLNARDRLAASINDVIRNYRSFLTLLTNKETEQHAPMFLDQTLIALTAFFDIYATEHATFNAGMHSAASNIRNILLPFRNALETTKLHAYRNRSYRAYLGADTLGKLRELLELDPLDADSKLAADPYLARHNKLFIDLQIDRQLGAGTLLMHPFATVSIDQIQEEWQAFCAACAQPTETAGGIEEPLEYDEDTQARLHARFVRSKVEEAYIASALVKHGY
ncbi:MAG: hypothetical protein GC149_16385 [Gammaproteobacteria bacterium]|nr:hypothetical protein [Gammaproteobacteria bacterium]